MIEVQEVEGYKFIRKDGLTQSVVPAYPGGYWEQMLPDEFKPESVLILGLGAGTIYKLLKEKFPSVKITAIDNNAGMVKIAKENGVSAKDIVEFDAFVWIENEKSKYDLIIVDLFDGFKFNMRVITNIFLENCKALLVEGGYLVVNVPNLSQCEGQFQAAKRSPVQNIYFYNKNTLVI